VAVASLPSPLAAVARVEHLPAFDEKARLSRMLCVFSRPIPLELGKLAALRGG
jgi:hypothetical protein